MKKHLPAEMLLIFAAFYLPGYFVTAPADPAHYMVQYLLVSVPQVLLLVYILWLQKPPDLAVFGFRRPRIIDWLYGFALLVILGLLLAAIRLLLPLLPETAEQAFTSGYHWKLLDPRFVPVALLFGLAAGYKEEIFYRAYLLNRLEMAGMPVWLAVLLSSLLFMWGHFYQGVAAVIFALFQSVIFCIVFLRIRNVHILAAAHGLYNFLALLLSLILPD